MIQSTLVAVATSAGVLVNVPPGPVTLILSNTSGQTVYIGGPGVTTTTGVGIPSGSPPVTIPGLAGSSGTTLYAVSGVAASLGVILSTGV